MENRDGTHTSRSKSRRKRRTEQKWPQVVSVGKKVLHILLLPAALLILTSCDYGRMHETPAVRPLEQPMLINEDPGVPFSGGEAVYRASNPGELSSPILLGDPGPIARGKKYYAVYCVHCHGENHDGRGTVGQSFSPLPGDLRSRKVQSLPEGVLFKEISYGAPGSRQPPLAATIDPTHRWEIIAFIKSLAPRK